MPEQYDHLKLPRIVQEYDRRKYGPPLEYKMSEGRDKNNFYKTQIKTFQNLKLDQDVLRKHYSNYFDPSLIFKIEVNQSVSEESFRNELSRMGIEVISPSPDKKGFWVVFAEDRALDEFSKKLKDYSEEKKQYKFFNAIEALMNIPPEEKIGKQLEQYPLGKDEFAYLDVEIWRMDKQRLDQFIDGDNSLAGLRRFIEDNKGRITDRLITTNFCLLRVYGNRTLFDEIVASFREIALIDRPPKPYITVSTLNIPKEELKIENPPTDNATGILVMDSGIISNHPLLEKAVGDEKSIPTKQSSKIEEDRPTDDVGHGTRVAGIALYGDVKECIDNKRFNPEVWIFSAKVMFAEEQPDGAIEAVYDHEELFEHQLEKSVRWIAENYPTCKVVNISFGNLNKRILSGRKQFNLSSLIDELAKELKIIFVISTGNYNDFDLNEYPAYLGDKTNDDTKIIDPASSALGLTIGSVAPPYGPDMSNQSDILSSPARTLYPSPFTRVGPGYNGMIKPELVEIGGNVISGHYQPAHNIGGKMISLNKDFVQEGKLFNVDVGTSFSTPKISNCVARLWNKYPDYSANLIKAIILSCASIPDEKPGFLQGINFSDSNKQLAGLLNVYGYGIPSLDKAKSSQDNRVLLIADDKIGIDHIHFYHFFLPEEFINESGNKQLAVTLVFDPVVNKNRIDYLGCIMEFHLFHSLEIKEIEQCFKQLKVEDREEATLPESIKLKEIDLNPGGNLRKSGVPQKGIKVWKAKGNPRIDINKPLVLAVICKNKWINDNNYLQDYAVIVTVKHEKEIKLYAKIRQRIQERIRIR
ncbi:MAG: S8 family peptidase [Nitrospirota bacterium]